MNKSVLILDDTSETLGELIKKLSEAQLKVRVCFNPQHALAEIEIEAPHLLIAAGQFDGMTAYQFAEKAFEIRKLPSYVILEFSRRFNAITDDKTSRDHRNLLQTAQDAKTSGTRY